MTPTVRDIAVGELCEPARNGGFFVARARGSPTDGLQKVATAIEKGRRCFESGLGLTRHMALPLKPFRWVLFHN
jgi:hypothetical protein